MQARKLFAGAVLLLLAATAQASSGVFEKRIDSGSEPVVDIRSSDGAVLVKGADTSEVVVKAKVVAVGRYARDPQKASRLIRSITASPPVEFNDGRVVIGELKRATQKQRLKISYVVTVPRDAEVNVHSETGNVRVSGVNGTVNATSDQGEVTLAATAN